MPHDLRRLPLALWGPRCRGAQVSHSRRHHRQFLCLRSGKRRCTEAERKTKCMCVRASVTDAHGGHSRQLLLSRLTQAHSLSWAQPHRSRGTFCTGEVGKGRTGTRRENDVRPYILYKHRRGAPHCRTHRKLPLPPEKVRTLPSSSRAPSPLFPA